MTLHPTILALPVALPLIFGALGLIAQTAIPVRRVRIQQTLTGIGIGANLVLALVLLVFTLTGGRMAFQMGLWPAPFGITVYLDALAAIMLTMVGLLSAVIFPFALATMDAERTRLGFFPMMLFLLMGANGAFITGDLFNLYVFYEVLLMSSFVLLTWAARPARSTAASATSCST